jgi:hypothetical protein
MVGERTGRADFANAPSVADVQRYSVQMTATTEDRSS